MKAHKRMIIALAALAALLLLEVVLMIQHRTGVRVSPTLGREAALPSPQTRGGMPLVEALASRRSQRAFLARPLSLEQVGQLCWAAQGITEPVEGLRTAPSAGGLFPVTLFVVHPNGVEEYRPRQHALQPVLAGDVRSRLQAAALDQPCVGQAPVCLVITVDYGRTASKYGGRAERYCLLEAGHVAQNVLLQATALGLASVPVGAFDDREAAQVLDLPPHLRPVYLLPVGHPVGKRGD